MNESRVKNPLVKEEIRQQLIDEYLSTEVSLRSLATKYNYNHNLIYRWIMTYQKLKKKDKLLHRNGTVTTLPEPEVMSTDVGWLQEELRLSKIRILLLEATIDISDEKFGTNMRKKLAPGSHENRTIARDRNIPSLFTVWLFPSGLL